jgi:Ca2+-binding RTX toxin-like protein
MSGDAGNNIITGGAGNDVILGQGGNDTLIGGAGNDELYGSLGANASAGASAFDDVGYDTLNGGTGDDTYYVYHSDDIIIEHAGEGIDSVESLVSYTLSANVENLYLSLASAGNFNATGNDLNNNVFGNYGDNVIDGGGGKDLLVGRYGNDHFVIHNEVGGEDVIADFWNEPNFQSYGNDLLRFNASEFGNIGPIIDNVNFFNVFKYSNGFGSGPQFILDGSDYTAPRLYFDSDGAGVGTGVLIATLNQGASYLSASDFERIA